MTDYLSLFPGTTQNKLRFMELAGAVFRQVTDLIALTEEMQSGFSFAFAEGKQLDDIAAAVGLKRSDIQEAGSACTDEDFRKYLMAKLALWTWNGTNETVPAVLNLALPGSAQTDNGDGTVTVSTDSGLPPEKVFPVPVGVRMIDGSQNDEEDAET